MTSPASDKSLWELIWDYDPNGLVAVDRDLLIRVVNPAFCDMVGAMRQGTARTPHWLGVRQHRRLQTRLECLRADPQ
ncbi:MAG: PAS domain-containing protein [Tepidisphaeraceae bacterium]